MNSTFGLVNLDDLSSYDIGTPSMTCHETTRESKNKFNRATLPDLSLYIEPTVSVHIATQKMCNFVIHNFC